MNWWRRWVMCLVRAAREVSPPGRRRAASCTTRRPPHRNSRFRERRGAAVVPAEASPVGRWFPGALAA